jgi:hypothetical protein
VISLTRPTEEVDDALTGQQHGLGPGQQISCGEGASSSYAALTWANWEGNFPFGPRSFHPWQRWAVSRTGWVIG